MKKNIILLFIGLGLSVMAVAQKKDIKKDKAVLKNSIKDKKEDKHEVGKDVLHFRIKAALKGRREVRRHRKSIHKQGEHLEAHGVKHPITKAKREVKADKDRKKGKD